MGFCPFTPIYLQEIDVTLSNSASRRRLSSGGGKPVQFSAFGREIPCETTAPGR